MVSRFGMLAVSCVAASPLLAGVPAEAHRSGTPLCGASDLAGAIIDVQGAAGSRFGRLILVNKSPSACHTKGFIGGQLIGTSGKPLPTTVRRNHRTPARTVVINSGAAGALTISWNVIPSGRPCPRAQWFRVTPPDGIRTLRVFFGDTPCRGVIDVGAVTNPTPVS